MPLNILDSAMTTGLLKTANKLSELTSSPAVQEDAMDNMGLQYVVPIGSIIVWTRNVLPAGYLTADGSAVSRTTYAALFSILGTTFGSGDGSTTFNLPNVTAGLTVSSGTLYYLIKYDNVSGLPPV
jgi:phage-related tail fiber protein